MESYFTVKGQSEGVYKEKGSKFFGFVEPVASEEDVKKALEQYHKTYHDARHHCYAYVLGQDQALFRANDDGEPHHSAGDPILGQIRSKSLTNVLVVVVRYFGGTKLGVSGLINAYKTAASEALNNNKILEVSITEALTINFSYEATNDVMKLVDTFGIAITGREYGEACRISGHIRPKHKSAFEQHAQLIKGLDYQFE